MMNHKKLFLALIIFTLLSCRENNVEFVQKQHLQAEKVQINEVNNPVLMTLKEKMLVVCSMNTDTVLYFYSVPDLKFLAANGRIGGGPRDFTHLPSFCENDSDKLIVSKYGNMLNLSVLTLDDNKEISVKKESKLGMVDPLNNMYIKNDSILVYFDIMHLVIKKYNLNSGEQIDAINLNSEGEALADSSHPCLGDVIYNDSSIVYSYNYQNRIDIYDFETMKLRKSIKGPGEIFVAKTMEDWKNSIRYYIGGYAGKNYFYCYYKGGAWTDSQDIILRAFSYNGEPIKEYSFDIFPGHPFIVDEENNYIYAYDSKNDGSFLRYKM